MSVSYSTILKVVPLFCGVAAKRGWYLYRLSESKPRAIPRRRRAWSFSQEKGEFGARSADRMVAEGRMTTAMPAALNAVRESIGIMQMLSGCCWPPRLPQGNHHPECQPKLVPLRLPPLVARFFYLVGSFARASRSLAPARAPRRRRHRLADHGSLFPTTRRRNDHIIPFFGSLSSFSSS